MSLAKYPIDYIPKAIAREKRTLVMKTVHDIAFGISDLDVPKYKRNKHLWCYSTDALNKVEDWLKSIHAIGTSNFKSFKDFEDLYDFVLGQIGTIPGISNVEVYDVSLYLGERMIPQVVPSDYVYVHGKLIEAARHFLKHFGVSIDKNEPRYRIKVSDFCQIYSAISNSRYAARAIEEWLCHEHDEIMK